jgi:hypothetical protein
MGTPLKSVKQMLRAPAGRLDFLLIDEGPDPSRCGEGAEDLAEGASLGRRSGRLWAAGEPPHDVPGGGHKIGEDTGFPPIIVSLLDVIVLEGDVLLGRGHVDEGVPGRSFLCERGGRVSFFYLRLHLLKSISRRSYPPA